MIHDQQQMNGAPAAKKSSRRRARQQQARQLQRPPTSGEIALSYERQFRKSHMKFMYVGMLLTFVVGSLCTVAAHYYNSRLTQEQRARYRVVVSLGTTPSQIASMQPMLEALIETQDTSPHMVYLVLPDRDLDGDKLHFEIPDFVSNYVYQKKLYLLTPDFDYGPITKVLYSIEMESFDTRIICMDGDDTVVDPTFISTFLQQSLHYPDSAIAFSGATLSNYFRPSVVTSGIKHPFVFQGSRLAKTADILNGPVVVQRRFFDVEAFTETVTESRESVRLASDFVLAAHLELQKVNRMVVPRSRKGATIQSNGAGSFAFLEAAYYLQHQLGIWKTFQFHNPKKLSEEEKDAINCAGGNKSTCRSGNEELLQQLDSKS